MKLLKELRKPSFIRRVSSFFVANEYSPSKSIIYASGSYCIVQTLRFYRTKKIVDPESGESPGDMKLSGSRKEAQAALLDYLHSTRSLLFLDAENMSKNSPHFLDKLLKRLDTRDTDVGRSLTRFLRYHPINEFEPFFESIGLKPSEYSTFLPRDLMFLSDDEVLLENYYILCNYGTPRNKIGKIYKEVPEIFRCEYGVLRSKLLSLERMGLSQSLVVKVIASSPHLLRDVSQEFIQVMEKLKNTGITNDFLEKHMKEGDSYRWGCMLALLCLLTKIGCSEKQLRFLFTQHPELLLEDSGHMSFSLVSFMLKFGSTWNEVHAVFLQFPQITAAKFIWNLWHGYSFLTEVEMAPQDIGSIICSHAILLGSCSLKKVNSLLSNLNVGKQRLCQIIKDDPNVLKKWVYGVRVEKVPEASRVQRARAVKTNFLLDVGFTEGSTEMEKALKVFRGKGLELRERFECLVNAGLSRKDVIEMVKVSPQILNQSQDVLETKIDFLVNHLGYSASALVPFPSYLCYTVKRVKLRLSLYKMLKDEDAADPNLALSTILACPEEKFVKTYVNRLPTGPEIWANLKKEIYRD